MVGSVALSRWRLLGVNINIIGENKEGLHNLKALKDGAFSAKLRFSRPILVSLSRDQGYAYRVIGDISQVELIATVVVSTNSQIFGLHRLRACSIISLMLDGTRTSVRCSHVESERLGSREA